MKRTHRGRGALSNPAGRFESRRVEPIEDQLDEGSVDDEPRVPTTVTPEAVRRILTSNDSPDVPFDRSLNPYKGCEHGCVYCFARPTHAYLGLSPGLDFETKIFSKPAAAARLREELAGRSYRPQVIALGANTDPYQPVERELRITRSVLEVLREHRHPVAIVTKSTLVLRDLDLLAPMAAENLANVCVSITTLDARLARRMEPRAASPSLRLETVRGLVEAGVPVGALASPMIPGLNDSEIEAILQASAEAGASWAGYVLIRLPHEVKDLFFEWLEKEFPTRASRVRNRILEAHGGRLYDPAFGKRMRGGGAYVEMLRRRFEVARRRFGLDDRPRPLDVSRFRVPGVERRLFPERPA